MLLAGIAILIVLTAILLVLQLTGRSRNSTASVQSSLDGLIRSREEADRTVREDLARVREEGARQAREGREELREMLKGANDSLFKQLAEQGRSSVERLDTMRETIERRLTALQEDNNRKLEKMRETVDEKLQSTLEKRLGESFRLVSERLEKVQRGLGEMQKLATEVGDLKSVMTNVKTRGTWGEVVLGGLLEEIIPNQYEKNVKVRRRSDNIVEYAIKLPGTRDEDGPVWLPIDSKFPKEDYERIVDAAQAADPAALEKAQKSLEQAVLSFARDIRDKYLAPPETTSFGILFLPTEGLYAEVVRRPGLIDRLQRDCRVNVCGPTTLAALLNSLQMGFRTLQIQKQSSEVWKILGGVKTEFSRFEVWIGAVQKKLESATREMDKAASRTRQITRRLEKIEELPEGEAVPLLDGTENEPDSDPDNDDA